MEHNIIKKIIKENNLYKRLLEFYIEKYGLPEEEYLQKTFEKIKELDNKEPKNTMDKNEEEVIYGLIDQDLFDYIHLHILSTKDYIEDAEKYFQIIKKMTHNLEKLIKKIKDDNIE